MVGALLVVTDDNYCLINITYEGKISDIAYHIYPRNGYGSMGIGGMSGICMELRGERFDEVGIKDTEFSHLNRPVNFKDRMQKDKRYSRKYR